MYTMKKFFSVALALTLSLSMAVPAFAAEAEKNVPEYEIAVVGDKAINDLQKAGVMRAKTDLAEPVAEETEDPLYEIAVSGEKNIDAYIKAGVIHTSAASQANGALVEERGVVKPTSVWNLYQQGCRSTTYSMSTWIYSNYQYDSGDYRDIWHTVYPNQVQKMTIQCYKANGTAWGDGHVSDYSDEEYAYGIATGNGVKVYFKYTSTNGKLISGRADIC